MVGSQQGTVVSPRQGFVMSNSGAALKDLVSASMEVSVEGSAISGGLLGSESTGFVSSFVAAAVDVSGGSVAVDAVDAGTGSMVSSSVAGSMVSGSVSAAGSVAGSLILGSGNMVDAADAPSGSYAIAAVDVVVAGSSSTSSGSVSGLLSDVECAVTTKPADKDAWNSGVQADSVQKAGGSEGVTPKSYLLVV